MYVLIYMYPQLGIREAPGSDVVNRKTECFTQRRQVQENTDTGLRLLPAPSAMQDIFALHLKEEALWAQREGDYKLALQLMRHSVALRENTCMICFSLSELADLYLEMLLLKEAEATCLRMLQEAYRMDTANQIRIAQEVLKDVWEAMTLGVTHGARVQLLGLVSKPQLNGQEGIIRGRQKGNGKYVVEVDLSMVLVKRENFNRTLPEHLRGVDFFDLLCAGLAPLLRPCTLARLQSLSPAVQRSFSAELATRTKRDSEVQSLLARRDLAISWNAATEALWLRSVVANVEGYFEFPATYASRSWYVLQTFISEWVRGEGLGHHVRLRELVLAILRICDPASLPPRQFSEEMIWLSLQRGIKSDDPAAWILMTSQYSLSDCALTRVCLRQPLLVYDYVLNAFLENCNADIEEVHGLPSLQGLVGGLVLFSFPEREAYLCELHDEELSLSDDSD